jgi:hypothetical protein
MALLDFLTDLGPGGQASGAPMPVGQADPSSLAQFLQPGMGGIDFSQFGDAEMTPQVPSMAAQQPTPAQPAQPKPSGGFRDFLGKLGDVLLLANDLPPMYLPMQQQREVEARQAEQQRALGEAMAQFVGQHPQFAGAAGVMQADPEIGMGLLKFLQPPSEPFTLGEGQARFGSDGRVIAQGPEKQQDRRVTVIDGIAFDTDTGTPVFRSPYPQVVAQREGAVYELPKSQPMSFGAGPASVRPTSGEMPRVNSEADVQRLPPGTRFIMPDGSIGEVPAMTNGQGGQLLSAAAGSRTITREEAARVLQSLGPNGQTAFENWLQRNNVVIGD